MARPARGRAVATALTVLFNTIISLAGVTWFYCFSANRTGALCSITPPSGNSGPARRASAARPPRVRPESLRRARPECVVVEVIVIKALRYRSLTRVTLPKPYEQKQNRIHPFQKKKKRDNVPILRLLLDSNVAKLFSTTQIPEKKSKLFKFFSWYALPPSLRLVSTFSKLVKNSYANKTKTSWPRGRSPCAHGTRQRSARKYVEERILRVIEGEGGHCRPGRAWQPGRAWPSSPRRRGYGLSRAGARPGSRGQSPERARQPTGRADRRRSFLLPRCLSIFMATG